MRAAPASVPAAVAPLPSPAGPPRGDRCAKLLVNAVKYTTLSWYVGVPHPYPRHRQAVLRSVGACMNALQIRGGNPHTLRLAGLACEPPLHAKEIMEDNTLCEHGRWRKTKCQARRVRGVATALEAKFIRAKDCHQKLFRYDDLVAIRILH